MSKSVPVLHYTTTCWSSMSFSLLCNFPETLIPSIKPMVCCFTLACNNWLWFTCLDQMAQIFYRKTLWKKDREDNQRSLLNFSHIKRSCLEQKLTRRFTRCTTTTEMILLYESLFIIEFKELPQPTNVQCVSSFIWPNHSSELAWYGNTF